MLVVARQAEAVGEPRQHHDGATYFRDLQKCFGVGSPALLLQIKNEKEQVNIRLTRAVAALRSGSCPNPALQEWLEVEGPPNLNKTSEF